MPLFIFRFGRSPEHQWLALLTLGLFGCTSEDPGDSTSSSSTSSSSTTANSISGGQTSSTQSTSQTSTNSPGSMSGSTVTSNTSSSSSGGGAGDPGSSAGGGSTTGSANPTGTGGSGGTGGSITPSDAYAGSIEVSVHDDVNTILVVTWEQLLAADATWLEFSFEGSEVMRSPSASGALGAHREVVLGVPGDTTVSISVVSQVGEDLFSTTAVEGTTDAVPASMPVPTVMDYDPERASPERYMLGAVEDTADNIANNLDSYLTYQAWLYIIDRQGRVVWYYTDPSRNAASGFPRVARDGSYLMVEQSRVGAQGRLLKMSLDREYFEAMDLPIADAFDITDDGSILYDEGYSGELHELTADGEDRILWHCGSELDLSPNCYTNTINYNPFEDSVLMSFPYSGVVAEIDRQSGELIGYYGNEPDAWDFAPPLEEPPTEWGFGFQHFPNITPTGTLIVSSHMPGYEDFEQTPTANQHAFIEFAIDRENQVLTELWRYTEGPEWPRARGMAIRLENGNTLGNYGTGGVIREITPDKATVFYVKFDIPGGNDAYNKLVGHNFLVADLYALNGAPE
ncbi:MAG TPA: hypothetical protein VFU02_06825 [Polyangiaceae bacterium]|nr:hypothetical protein [Polyangiaceae bacterium]